LYSAVVVVGLAVVCLSVVIWYVVFSGPVSVVLTTVVGLFSMLVVKVVSNLPSVVKRVLIVDSGLIVVVSEDSVDVIGPVCVDSLVLTGLVFSEGFSVVICVVS